MDAVYPSNMGVDILDIVLEGNNVVTRDGLAVLAGDGGSATLANKWDGERGTEKGGSGHSHRLDVDHDDEKVEEKVKRRFDPEYGLNELVGWEWVGIEVGMVPDLIYFWGGMVCQQPRLAVQERRLLRMSQYHAGVAQAQAPGQTPRSDRHLT